MEVPEEGTSLSFPPVIIHFIWYLKDLFINLYRVIVYPTDLALFFMVLPIDILHSTIFLVECQYAQYSIVDGRAAIVPEGLYGIASVR